MVDDGKLEAYYGPLPEMPDRARILRYGYLIDVELDVGVTDDGVVR